MKKAIVSVAFGLAAGLFATGASAQATLASVKQKGFLTCGSNTGLAGFSVQDAQGDWTGLDVEFCRAISAAIFDDPPKVQFVSALRQGPLHRAAVRRSRHAGP